MNVNFENFYSFTLKGKSGIMFNIFTNIFMFITMTLSICWSFPFIFTALFGLKLFRVSDPKKSTQLLQSFLMNNQKSGLLESTTLGISKRRKATMVTSENYSYSAQKNILTRRLKISTMLPRMKIETRQIARN